MTGKHGLLPAVILTVSLTAASLSFPVHASSGTEAPYYYGCVEDSCYIYSSADTSSEKIAYVSEGGVCRVLEEEGGWAKVFSGGYTGYIKLSWLDTSEETLGGITSQEGVTADRDILIYAEADSRSTVIAERPAGATELMAEDPEEEETDGWISIEFVTDNEGNTETGWVREKYVTPAKIVTDAEPYLGDVEDGGILIESEDDILIEEAEELRAQAEELRNKSKNSPSSTDSSSSGSSSSGSSSSSGTSSSSSNSVRTGTLNRYNGTVMGPSGKETYYNLDMSGVVEIMRRVGYSEEEYPYWVREDGVKMLGPYIMCAADLNLRPRGSLVESSLGTCIVADTGDFIYANPTQIDIAVTW